MWRSFFAGNGSYYDRRRTVAHLHGDHSALPKHRGFPWEDAVTREHIPVAADSSVAYRVYQDGGWIVVIANEIPSLVLQKVIIQRFFK